MPRLPRNPSVRRRLFSSDGQEARIDNCTNLLHESLAVDMEIKKQKYNYDFTNDCPLDGPIKWYQSSDSRYDWIGVPSDVKLEETYVKEDEPLNMQSENENTPKSNREGESVPLVKKRRMENISTDKEVKRKLNFE